MPSQRRCELCGEAAAATRTDLGTCVLVLCATHRRAVKQAGATSLEAVRALFTEPDGRRALVERRQGDRRLFPPRPEGRRRAHDRRDAAGPGAEPASEAPAAPSSYTRPTQPH